MFEPNPGVTSTLTVPQHLLIEKDNGHFVGMHGFAYNPADTAYGATYTLTTKEGIQFDIDAQCGQLSKVTDLNDNTLKFTGNGVDHSSGKSVTFERDPRGRITAVVDPQGRRSPRCLRRGRRSGLCHRSLG